MLPENPYNRKENDTEFLHLLADEENGAISGCSPGYTSIQTKITHKSNNKSITFDSEIQFHQKLHFRTALIITF